MNRINRRRFVAVTSVAATSAVLVACGNSPLSEDELNPTQIPDVPGAPPTLAPITSTPGAAPESGNGGGDTGGGSAPAAVTIEAHDDFTFSPSEVEVAPGQTVTVTNAGFMQHDLVSDDLAIGTDLLNNGESQDIVIPEDAAVGETFKFHCTVAGHEQSGMVGSFTIVEAGAAAPAGEEDATAETGGGGATEAITIEAHDDFSFSPNEVEVAPGQTVTVTNAGFMQHDLVSDDLGIGTAMLNGGDSEDIVIPEDAAVGETFKFHCTVAGHEQSGMVGSFTIVEAGAAAPAGDEAPAEEEATAAEGAATGGGEAIIIEAHDDFSFSPSEVEVAPGQTVTVTNAGFMQHDLVSDDLGIGTAMLNGGDSEDIVIPEDAAVGETFKFHCTVAGHEQSGMVGSFTIVEGGSTAAAPAAESTAEEEATAAEGAATGGGEAVTIEALDSFKFEPSEVEVAPGQTVTVTNAGFMQHDLVSKDLGVGTAMLNGGDSEDIVIPADAAVGESFKFICTVAGHEQSGMVGTFTIVEGGSSAAAPAGDAEATAEEDSAESTPEEAVADNSPMATTVIGTQWQFSPAEFEMAPGGVLTWQNDADMMMGLSSEAWDDGGSPFIKSIAAGKTAEFTIPSDAEVGSEIEFKSNLSEAEKQGMVGKITIVAGDGAVASPAASPAAASGDAVEVEANDDFSFTPNKVEVSAGQTVTLTNAGFMQHDLVCGDLDIGTDLLNNGQTADVVIPDSVAAGETYKFICTVAGHEQSGMVGEFVIV